jgi:hypothetical protein
MANRTGKGGRSIGGGSDAGSYEVGYCKPPTGTRFQKGQSGNPKGRRKGTKNFAAIFLKAMGQTVTITENGKPKKISKLDAAVTQLANNAARGDKNSIQIAVDLVQALEPATKTQSPQIIYSGVLADADRTVWLLKTRRGFAGLAGEPWRRALSDGPTNEPRQQRYARRGMSGRSFRALQGCADADDLNQSHETYEQP